MCSKPGVSSISLNVDTKAQCSGAVAAVLSRSGWTCKRVCVRKELTDHANR